MKIRGLNRFWAAAAAASAALTLSSATAEERVVPHALPQVYALLLDDNPFNSLVSKRGQRASAPDVERYVTTDGERQFLFQSDASSARIKFLCAPSDPRLDCALPDEAEEVLLLTPNRGPRGDLFFKSAEGDTVLRVAAHGGAIVTWPGAEANVGAVRTETRPGDTLRLAALTSSSASRRADAASAALAAEIGRPISFDIGWRAQRSAARPAAFAAEQAAPLAAGLVETAEGEASVLADAIARAAAGIEKVARDRAGAKAVSERIASVRFVEAPRPALSLDGRTLIVSYNPGGGLAGRPSSSEVARFLEGVL